MHVLQRDATICGFKAVSPSLEYIHGCLPICGIHIYSIWRQHKKTYPILYTAKLK